MQTGEQRKVFLKIVLASLVNIIGFGLAVAFIGYLKTQTDLVVPVKILTAVVLFVMAISLNTLLVFIVYTIKGMPETMANKPENLKFSDIYGYTIAALSVRLVEAAICIAYLVYLYRIFFK